MKLIILGGGAKNPAKKYTIMVKTFNFNWSKYEQKPEVDLNSWSAVHKPDTLTTELYWYSTKSIDTVW